MTDILEALKQNHTTCAGRGCVTCRAFNEIEELRAAICGAFELTAMEAELADAVTLHRSVWDEATHATILRILKEQEKRNGN